MLSVATSKNVGIIARGNNNSHNFNRVYLSGMNRDEWVAPIPGRPCFTGLYDMENSAK